jgi:hypothetical protein
MDQYCFPPELVNPKLKEDPMYGLRYAQAAYYSNNRYGSMLFHQDNDFDALIELAQGRQSTDNISKLFGRHYAPGTQRPSDGPESISYIDLQVLNLAPKYINRAVAKMQRMNYDIALEAVDIVSTDYKKNFAATVQAYYRYKDWAQKIGVPIQTLFPDLDVSTLPANPDELLYDLHTNPKIKGEIGGELALQLIQSINNFRQKMRQVDWDMVVTGMGHIHCYHDANMIPRMDRIDPRFWSGSYVDNDDFEQQEYAFFYDCISANQFIREASGEFSQQELQEIIQRYSLKNQTYANNLSLNNKLSNYDNLDYIPVIKFYFRSEDNDTWVSKKNQYGSKILLKKSFDYQPGEDVAPRFAKNGDSKLIKNTYTSIYGGTWIIDSDVCYNYDRKKVPRTNLVEASIPIKTFGTNYKNGRCVSFASQMVEPLYMVNVAWNKIKETLAKGWIGQREINLSKVEEVALGSGGRKWSPREVIELLVMDGTLMKRDEGNQFSQSNGNAVEYHQTGVQLSDHFNTLQLAFNILDQMTGASIPEAAEKPDRPSVWGMKASVEAADLDMEYLYNAHQYIYERCSHQMLLLMQETKRNKVAIRNFIPALGSVHTGIYEIPDEVAYCDYGMRLMRQPTSQEWADFYLDVRIMLEQGRIGASDSAFIRNIDNLKQAREILGIREQQYERKVMQAKERDIQANMEANERSLERAEMADLRLIQEEGRVKAELLQLEGQIKSHLQKEKSNQDGVLKGIEGMTKKYISDRTTQVTVIKEGIRSNADKYTTTARLKEKEMQIQAKAQDKSKK